MNSTNLLTKMASGALALSFLFLIGATSVSAQSRGRDRDRNRDNNMQRQRDWEQQRERDRRGWGRGGRYNDGYPDLGGTINLRQTALNAGANAGIKEGRKDRSRGERFDFRDEGAYQSATKDYSSRLGDRETYRRYFRLAFESAYRDGYAGY